MICFFFLQNYPCKNETTITIVIINIKETKNNTENTKNFSINNMPPVVKHKKKKKKLQRGKNREQDNLKDLTI